MNMKVNNVMNDITVNVSSVITGRENIEHARWLAVRSALKLETKGFKRSRGSSARQLANAITGQNHKTAVKAYAALNKHIVSTLGEGFDKPLP
jgi:hypothetical protein